MESGSREKSDEMVVVHEQARSVALEGRPLEHESSKGECRHFLWNVEERKRETGRSGESDQPGSWGRKDGQGVRKDEGRGKLDWTTRPVHDLLPSIHAVCAV